MHLCLVFALLIAQSVIGESSYSSYAYSTPTTPAEFSFDSVSYSFPDTDASAVFGILRTGTDQSLASVSYYTIDGTARAGVGKQRTFLCSVTTVLQITPPRLTRCTGQQGI